MDKKICSKLYAAYNPSYKNKELLKDYETITNKKYKYSAEKQFADKVVRQKYNDIIMKDYHNEAVIKYHLTNYLMKQEKYFVENKQKDYFDIMYEVNTGIANDNETMSRCDMVTVNRFLTDIPGFEKHLSKAFEIKTEYDSLKRLPEQLKNYQKLFNNVCVVAHESKEKELFEMLKNTNVIILLYDKNIEFRILKSADKWVEHNYQPFVNNYKRDNLIDPKKQLACLTLNYLRKATGIKEGDRTIYNAWSELRVIDNTANDYFVDYLHYKYNKNWSNLKKQIESKTIYPLDYQWFFKNTIDTSLVYNR